MTYTITAQSPLSRLCQDVYPSLKAQYPTEGRRKLRLRVAEHFWALEPQTRQLLTASQSVIGPVSWTDASFNTDPDPWDQDSRDNPEIGILVRTDYTNEDAWEAFRTKLQDAEKEFASEAAPDDSAMNEEGPSGSAALNAASGAQEAMQEDEEPESSSDEEDSSIFKIISPSSQEARLSLTGISNLVASRLFNDMDIRPAPTPPEGTKRIKPPNRLVDDQGWQEVYSGKRLWIYDAKSNDDQCVRLVNQQGDMYGTATADSWRARVSHICELQVNLYSGAMKIDFGGLDRWDYSERLRNMQEATVPIT